MNTKSVDLMRYLSSKINLEKVETHGSESIRIEASTFKRSMVPKEDLAVSIDSLANVEVKGLLYEGAYGNFYKGKLKDIHVAIQPLNVTVFKADEIQRRRKLLLEVQHKNVLKLFATYLDYDNLVALFITQDVKMTLRSFYEDFVPKCVTARLMIQLVDAIKFVHEKNIILLDINPTNINISTEENLLISYFGKAQTINPNEIVQPLRQLAGLPEYMDTDALDFKYSKSSDIFSVACILFEIWNNNAYLACPNECILLPKQQFYKQVLERGRPYIRRNSQTNRFELYNKNGCDREDLLTRLQENLMLSCQEDFYRDFYDLFYSMLNTDSGLRMGADDVLRSPAFDILRKMQTFKQHSPSSCSQLSPKTFIGSSFSQEDIVNAKVRFLQLFGFSGIYSNEIDPCLRKPMVDPEVIFNFGERGDCKSQHVIGTRTFFFETKPMQHGPDAIPKSSNQSPSSMIFNEQSRQMEDPRALYREEFGLELSSTNESMDTFPAYNDAWSPASEHHTYLM